MGTDVRRRARIQGGGRHLPALVLLSGLVWLPSSLASAELPPPPAPFEIRIRVTRPVPPPPPEPFTIQLVVVRPRPPQPPQPFTIQLTVLYEPPAPPAPFPLRVTVVRPPPPPPLTPFPLRVTVVRPPPPPPPQPFALALTVVRPPPPPPPAPFALAVTVSRRDLPSPPSPFPLQLTVVRPPPPPPPAPFLLQVTVVRPGADPEVSELLAELRRLEAASAEEAEAARRSAEDLRQGLQEAQQLLTACQAEIHAAERFLGASEMRLEALAALRDGARRGEELAKAAARSVVETALEVCALDSGASGGTISAQQVTDLEKKVEAAGVRAGEAGEAAGRCQEGSDQLRREILDWRAQWSRAVEGATGTAQESLAEAATALLGASLAAEELGEAAIRLGELEGAAEPLIEEIEERAAAWTSPAMEEIRQEVLSEERRLAGKISGRVAAVLEGHDFQVGAIESQENELTLARSDIQRLAGETSRVRQHAQGELARLLAETDTAAEQASVSADRAGEEAAKARGCLERIRGRVGEELKTVPGVVGRSEGVAVASIEESDLRPFLLGGESTLDATKVGKVARQAPAAGSRLPPGGTVSLWIYASATKTEPTKNVPSLTQATCTADWPGTILVTEPGGGNPRCECPAGEAWSKVSNRCLALSAAGPGGANLGGDRSCTARPGTVFSERSGRCECPYGSWSSAEGRCVDARVAERQKEIDNARAGVDCERMFSNIRVFRRHPSSMHRQMATSAESRARALGCDESAIRDAVEEGDRRVWVTPQSGGGGDAVRVGPEIPEQREDLQPLTRSSDPSQTGGDERGTPRDCSHCKVYSDWLYENRKACGYHGNRLPSICDADPECLRWNQECGRHKRLLDECNAQCMG